MSDFVVLPKKSELVEEVARQLRPRLQDAREADALATGAVELLWGHREGLNAAAVVEVLCSAEKLQEALRAFEEHSNAVQMWSDQFRGSPDGAVRPDRLVR